MKSFINFIVKKIISFFCHLIKNNTASRKYLFTVALRNEVQDFYDHHYFQGYAHITKAIAIAKSKNLDLQCIIDVGGADGTTPKMFLQNLPAADIWIFEPLKENHVAMEYLEQDNRIHLIKKAAGNTIGKTTIHKTKRITSSSILPLHIDKSSEIFSSILEETSTETIEITTLDAVIPNATKVSILKLDVQGFELEVLKGGTSTLLRTAIIVVEMNNHDSYTGAPKYFAVDDFLRSANFTLFDIFPSTKDKGMLKEWDAVYMRTSLL